MKLLFPDIESVTLNNFNNLCLKPAIAFFHGGGWSSGSPSEFHEACERYARKGFIAFSFQYRLSRTKDGAVPHPDITPVECVKDVRSAIRWIRINASEFGIDPEKIVAIGQSAGGQLALSTALIDDVNEASDNFEFSPITENITQNQKSLIEFLISICAIIGGVYTIAGIVDSMIHKSVSLVFKSRIGKLS